MNINQKIVLFTLGGVAVGAAGGYIYADKKLKKHYDAIVEEEIASVKDTYHLLTKQGKYQDDREATKEYLSRLDELQYLATQEEDEEDEEELETNGSTPYIPEPDDAKPLKVKPVVVQAANVGHVVDVMSEPRDPKVPYLISTEEFMNEGEDNEKITINYYAEDDTLADERDEVIPDVEGTVGLKNLSRWGDGSDSEFSVYVRNERLRTDFEVLREDTSYAKMMMGEDWENQPIRSKPRKMPSDE